MTPIAPRLISPDLLRAVRRSAHVCLGSCFVVAALSLASCSGDPTPPASSVDPDSRFEATLDPGNDSFVFSRVSTSERDVDIVLVGTHLVADPATETVSLDVAIRNASEREVAGAVTIWLSDFRPAGVEPINAEMLDSEGDGASRNRFGFDYTATFGEDGTLRPNEISAAKSWVFRSPGQASFSFSASANFGSPSGAVLGGSIYHDLDGDGVRDEDEEALPGGVVLLTRADGTVIRTEMTDRGRYQFPVREAGLYLVAYEPPRLDCLCEVVGTTANPLEVLIVPDANGKPQDYLEAHFGARIIHTDGEEVVPILLTDRDPHDIRQDRYRLGDAALRGDVLSMKVDFSGCSPNHPFTLYMTGGFMESDPVQARIVLGHDDLGELCDAAFARTLLFDLRPLREAYERAYGHAGTVRLRLTDVEGQDHEFRYVWE